MFFFVLALLILHLKGTTMNRNKYSGFTLLELIIVIIIIGILFTTAIPFYLDLKKDAETASNKAKMAAIRAGIDIIHAKIIVSGQDTGPDGANPAWPTFEELKANELLLDTRPEGLRYLRIVRSFDAMSSRPEDYQAEDNDALLPPCSLPDMTTGMAGNLTAVTRRTLSEATANPRLADESTCWAYYPGNEKNNRGQFIDPVLYINDDRPVDINLDAKGRRPSQW